MSSLDGLFGGLALAFALINLVRRDWASTVIVLALQYLALFLLILSFAETSFALIRILVGWMSTLVIYLTLASSGMLKKLEWPPRFSASQGMRLMMGLLVIAVIWALAPNLGREVFPFTPPMVLVTSLGLMVLGILQVGMREEPIYVTVALLTFFSGLSILYGSIERSTVLEGLFAALDLSLALTGAYLIVKVSDVEGEGEP